MAAPHGYREEVLPRAALDALALFVAKGQIDLTQYIDYETKTALGDADNGTALFQTICAVCHGLDGTDMSFGNADDPVYVGTLSNDNPWEILHKIRFGHPGAPIVALFALDVEDQVDVLTLLQRLP
jgi:mono/diheme cytochrome c family protein